MRQLITLLLSACLVLVGGVSAQTGVVSTQTDPSTPIQRDQDVSPVDTITDDEVNAVAKHLFCPVCESEPLNTCLAPTCFEWRSEIRHQLAQGRTQQEIIDYFVAEAGQHVVGLPQDNGLRLLSIGGPLVIGLIALGVGLFTIRRWRNNAPVVVQSPNSADNSVDEDEDYRARLERDLQDF